MMDSNFYQKNDILSAGESTILQVIEDPHKKWYKVLLQFITFGLYKAPYQYKVKTFRDGKC